MRMETYANEYREVLGDKTFRLTAERLVIKCGVRADLNGFNRLVDAVILYGTGMSTSFCEIYSIIGALHKQKPKSVMRVISYAINQDYEVSGRLSEMLGVRLKGTDIHSGLVIAYLGSLFRHPDLSVYS